MQNERPDVNANVDVYRLGHVEESSNMFISFIGHATGDFAPSHCNSQIETTPCVPWTSMFPESTNTTLFSKRDGPAVNPCGTCVLWDLNHLQVPSSSEASSTVTFQGGLDIQGKLIIDIPDDDGATTRVNSATTWIVVQGVLEMYARQQAVTGTPAIHVFSLKPIPQNQHACGIAEGRVTLSGLPSSSSSNNDMPTWVPVIEVSSTALLMDQQSLDLECPSTSTATLLDCSSTGILMDTIDFSRNTYTYRATLGTSWQLLPDANSLRVYRRTHVADGLQIDLQDIRHCLDTQTTYLLTLRIRLEKPGVPKETLTDCAKNNTQCLELQGDYLTSAFVRAHNSKWKEQESHQYRMGEEITIAITDIYFDKHELRANNTHQALILRGVAPGTEIHLLEWTLRAAPLIDSSSRRGNLVPFNGDAESVGLSPYPFSTNNPNTHISVVQDEDTPFNHYFQITGRQFALHGMDMMNMDEDWNDVGLSWSLEDAGVDAGFQEGALYRIHADVRIHNTDSPPTVMEISIRSRRHGDLDDIYVTLVTCPPSQNEWVSCDGEFRVPANLTDDQEHTLRYDVLFEILWTFSIDYDVDNLSFELAEGPLNRLIVSDAVQHYWATGAEVLLTSHTLEWEDCALYTSNLMIFQDWYDCKSMVRFADPKPLCYRSGLVVKEHRF
jgi:hypothetical protein